VKNGAIVMASFDIGYKILDCLGRFFRIEFKGNGTHRGGQHNVHEKFSIG
jgi:hypothetical protein